MTCKVMQNPESTIKILILHLVAGLEKKFKFMIKLIFLESSVVSISNFSLVKWIRNAECLARPSSYFFPIHYSLGVCILQDLTLSF